MADAIAVRAPGLEPQSRLELDFVLTVGDRPELRDPPDVHDVGAVDAQEAAGIEHAFDGVHRHVQHVRRRADVQADVVLQRFDPIHLVDTDQDRALA